VKAGAVAPATVVSANDEEAFRVELVELAGVTLDPRERERLARSLGGAVEGRHVDRRSKRDMATAITGSARRALGLLGGAVVLGT
jgi:hypothetical protein